MRNVHHRGSADFNAWAERDAPDDEPFADDE